MSLLRKIGRFIKWTLILFFLLSILAVVAYRFLPVRYTPLMVMRCAQQFKHGKQLRLVHHWVPLDSINSELAVAVIACEDQNFLNHSGFDFDAIRKARKEAKDGKRERGASTISQQTAKNVFLLPTHSWTRKAFEAYFTLLIELFWSKERIMEVYLNSIEMGDGIYGAEAVAQEHFQRHAYKLTTNQCALIALSLPNPIKRNSANPSRYMLRRQTWCLKQMKYIRGTAPFLKAK